MADKNKDDSVDTATAKQLQLGGFSFSQTSLVIFGSAALFFVGIAFFLMFSANEAPKEIKSPPISEVVEIVDPDSVISGVTYAFDPFVLNLRDGSGIIQIKVSLNFYELELPPYFKALVPRLRDRIISEVTKYNAEQIIRLKNRESLRIDIQNGLNDLLKKEDGSQPLKVVGVFFEEFNVR